jgi:hypothetical protein
MNTIGVLVTCTEVLIAKVDIGSINKSVVAVNFKDVVV